MRVMRPDLEVWATQFLRGELDRLGMNVEVDSMEPAGLRFPLDRPLVVIREDPGQKTSPVVFDTSLGVSVLAGSRQDDGQARRLANRVFAILTDEDLPMIDGSPVVEIGGGTGPYSVEDPHDVARRYMTVQWAVVGSW